MDLKLGSKLARVSTELELEVTSSLELDSLTALLLRTKEVAEQGRQGHWILALGG